MKARLQAASVSAFVHSVAISAVFWLLVSEERPEKVDIRILESPVEAPRAVAPAPQALPKPKKEVPRSKAVFGVSRNSITSATGLEEKAGNTVAKAPDQEKLTAEDADSLPIPADEIEVTRMPSLLSEVRVPYPAEAKQRGAQGAVVMDLLIDAEGVVREVKLIEGPGFGLNEAAIQAVRGFRFSPARIEERSVAVRIRYAYRFVLER